jgi:hypothetical protein
MASMWGNMMSAQNIMSMTSSVGQGIQGYLQASAMEYGQKTQDLLEDYTKQSREMTEKYIDTFGLKLGFDAMAFTDYDLLNIAEFPQTFLDRTLLVGSDIADMTLDMLTNFAEYTLNTDTIGS